MNLIHSEYLPRLQDKKYPDILEVACDTGRVTAHLVNSKHDTLTATDLGPMIKVAKDIVQNDSIKWMPADANLDHVGIEISGS